MNSDNNFWTFISKRLKAEAALADWRLVLGDKLDFDRLQRQYLAPTGKMANLIMCPEQCNPSCGFRKVCEWEGKYEAVCRERMRKDYTIEKVDALFFTVKPSGLLPEITKIFRITPHIEEFGKEEDTWKLGVVPVQGGRHAMVYLTLKSWSHEIMDLIYRLNCEERKPYILLVTARKIIHGTSEKVLNDMGSAFVPLNEVLDFNADTEFELLWECNLVQLVAPPIPEPEPEPENIFRKCGDAWEVRFQGGEKFMLLEVNLGAQYIHLLLQNPHENISVLKITSSQEPDLKTDQISEFDEGFSISSHPDKNTVPFADHTAIRQYREEEQELILEIENAQKTGDNVWQRQLENDLKQIRMAINQAISPAGQYKLLNAPIKNASNSLRNAVNRAIHKIQKYDRNLSSHLKSCIHFGQNAVYAPPEPIHWEL